MRPQCFLLFLLFACSAFAQAPPPDPPEVKALAKQVIDAPDDAARDKILADAPPAIANHPQFLHALIRGWGPLMYSGEYDRAIGLDHYSMALAEARGNRSEAGVALWYLGNIEGSRGENAAALERYERCEKIFAELHEEEHLAGVVVGSGIIHLQLGDYRQALAEFRQGETIYRKTGYKEGLISTINSIGNVFDAEGMTDRALQTWEDALKLAGDDDAWKVYLFHNIANARSARGDLAGAIDLLNQSIVLAEKLKDQPRLAASLQEIGSLYQQTGKPDLAEADLRLAIKMGEDLGDKRRQTSALTCLGDLLRRSDDANSQREALTLVERSSAIARETGEPLYIWRSRTVAGQLCRALRKPDDARAAFEEAIAAIEDARGHIASDDESAAAFLEDKIEPYQGMAALLVENGKPLEALAMAERAKARVLIEIMHSPKVDPATAMSVEERAEATRLQAAVTDANRKLAAARAASAPNAAELEAAVNAARLARHAAENDFVVAHPDFRKRQAPSADDLSPSALNRLANDATLIEYVVAEDETLVFTVSPGKEAPEVQAVRLPLGRASLEDQTRTYRDSLASRALDWQTGARKLGAELLEPVAAKLAGAQRVVIVPDGPLWDLPFQTLALGNSKSVQTLWEAYPLEFAPSFTFLALTPAAPAPDHPARLLAVGNPTVAAKETDALMGNEGGSLPEAERQVHALAELYGAERSKTMVGAEAHEDAFKKAVCDYDVIHLATHGILNDEAPMYSRLLMSQTDLAPDEDGFFEAWEWLPLKLHARLAVLAACETGRGKVGAGEGLLGMSWALFSAGCPASVVSQWKVDSASTTELMIAFHRELLAGKNAADALRNAGLALTREPKYRHPFYWAPFVLVGACDASRPAVAAVSDRPPTRWTD